MDFGYDPSGPGVFWVRFEFREKISYSRQLDFFRTLDYDDEDEVIGVEFVAPNTQGINLEGVPHADEIAEAIRAFRAATTQFAPAQVQG